MSKIQYYECNEYGHFKRNCPKLKKDNNNKRKREEARVTQEVKEDDKKHSKEDDKPSKLSETPETPTRASRHFYKSPFSKGELPSRAV